MYRIFLVWLYVALFLVAPAIADGPVFTDRELTSTTRSNCLRAIELTNAAAKAHGQFETGGEVARIAFDVVGTRRYAGHASAATMVRDHEVRGRAEIAAGATHANYTYSYDPEVKRQIVLNGERVVQYRTYADPEGGEPTHQLRNVDLDEDREIVVHLLPQELLRLALDARDSLRYLGEEVIDDRPHDVVCFPRPNGVQTSLLLDRETNLVSRVEELDGNCGRGDVSMWSDYSDWQEMSGLTVPGRYESRRLSRGSFRRFDLEFIDYQLEADWSAAAFELPDEIATELDGWVVLAPDGLPEPSIYWGWDDGQITETDEAFSAITTVAEDLYLLRMPLMDSQVMFYEFDDYVAVFEAPINSATGRLVIDTIRKQTEKPIRYVTASHHHAHYFGGFRPFIHEGVTVVAAAENAKYIEHLATWPHTFIPDELSESGKTAEFEIVEGKLVLADDHHRVEIFDVGIESGHTEEYLVFYFPDSQVLFNGDLVIYPNSGRIPNANARSRGLYDLIQRENLEIDWIYNSWPIIGDYARRGTMAELAQRPGIDAAR